MQLKTIFIWVLLTFLSIPVINSCNENKQSSKKTKEELAKEERANNNDKAGTIDTIVRTSSDCDPNLWKYVYNPERLQILDKCKTVTGTIEETNADEDGDQHMLLKLDKGQEKLLTKRNIKKKQGDLVIEAVCINKISRKKAMGACKGYVNNVELPKVGDQVKVTGSYVIDSHNGWAEIHPITEIVIIK
jgi:hypothetical protein